MNSTGQPLSAPHLGSRLLSSIRQTLRKILGAIQDTIPYLVLATIILVWGTTVKNERNFDHFVIQFIVVALLLAILFGVASGYLEGLVDSRVSIHLPCPVTRPTKIADAKRLTGQL